MAPRVYASLPMTGPVAPSGRELLRGAELAFERRGADAELIALDAWGEDRDRAAEANARRAVADPGAVAYLGDFHSSQVMRTAAILSSAGMLQVAPGVTFTGLRGATLVRLTPDDRMLADAIAGWVADTGIRALLVVHDHDDDYGVPVGRMCADAAARRGIDTRSRPVWGHDEPTGSDIAGMGAVLYVGVAGSGANRAVERPPRARSRPLAARHRGDRPAMAGPRDQSRRRRANAVFRGPTGVVGPVRVRGGRPHPRRRRAGERRPSKRRPVRTGRA